MTRVVARAPSGRCTALARVTAAASPTRRAPTDARASARRDGNRPCAGRVGAACGLEIARDAGAGSVRTARADGRVRRDPAVRRATPRSRPPAATRSIASFARRVGRRVLGPRHVRRRPAPEARRASPATSPRAGWSFASFTRQRPCSCSTMSFESRNRSTRSRPARRASSSARTTPVHSATLFVWMAEELRDRRVGPGRGSQRVGPRAVDQGGARATPGRGCRAPRRRSG